MARMTRRAEAGYRDDVEVGLKSTDFPALNDGEKKKMLLLIARIHERAYRRGVQQGAYFHKNNPESICRDPTYLLYDWRYRTSLDVAPPADSSKIIKEYSLSSLDRLMVEEGDTLKKFGLLPEPSSNP